MEIGTCLALPISDASHTAEIRRQGQIFAAHSGFDEIAAGKLAIIVTEAATNILKHAGEGEIIFQAIARNTRRGVEMLALDKGPGMADPDQCLRDGYTTAGTQGSGLGAIKRQASEFDIYSLPGKGTVVSARLWAGPAPDQDDQVAICNGISICMPGEEVCGDGWATKTVRGVFYLMVSDGLGHGPMAAAASAAARCIFLERDSATVSELLKDIHLGLKSTRGAAISITALNLQENSIRYAGVGNISGAIIDGQTLKHMVSINGTMGHTAHKFQEFTYPWPDNATVIMYSDGLQTRWALNDYPGIVRRQHNILPAALYRDHSRRRDDTTVVLARRKVA